MNKKHLYSNTDNEVICAHDVDNKYIMGASVEKISIHILKRDFICGLCKIHADKYRK